MKPFVIYVEGLDRTGKDTLIKSLFKEFHYQTPFVLHCNGFPKSEDAEFHSQSFYRSLIRMTSNEDSKSWILNRSHIGESVYSPLYRDYSGDYIFDLEKDINFQVKNHVLLFLYSSDLKSLYNRDDGDSLGSGLDSLMKEYTFFDKAIDRSIIPNKYKLDIKDKSILQVRTEIMSYLLYTIT